jgi:GNAT superfamily N-acetyltransferase
MTDFSVERLATDAIGRNVALAQQVGWPDTEGDWTVIHEGALVVGVWAEGSLVGQGALGLYGRAGTIAKMIVAPRFQQRGLGAEILRVLLAEASNCSMTALGLVATPFGRPLYEREGFVAVGDVVGLGGTPHALSPHPSTRVLEHVEPLLGLDQRWLGCSREAVLRARFRQATTRISILGRGDELAGYALATAQGEHSVVGPVVAETEAQARALVQSILCSVARPVRIDVPGEHVAFRQWLGTLGLREQKRRPEMARGCSVLPWQVPQRFALAAQAWG